MLYAINRLRSLGIRVRHAMEKVSSSSPDNNFPEDRSLPGEIQTPGNSGLPTLPRSSLAKHCGSEWTENLAPEWCLDGKGNLVPT
ncbi:hypothetical protein CEXT_785291 [Caerostris extrusa]|uniref:Uncharacterized protein n=1 Tax=Caerostris extrusa TaxID=172846 RepID=A0AAV4TQM5_CAEEX|nr:hypothetical protein CEXT_785291 [Caerostris extrusa]